MKPHTDPPLPSPIDRGAAPPDGPDALDDATLAVRLAALDALADELSTRPHLPAALRAALIERVTASHRAHDDARSARLARAASPDIIEQPVRVAIAVGPAVERSAGVEAGALDADEAVTPEDNDGALDERAAPDEAATLDRVAAAPEAIALAPAELVDVPPRRPTPLLPEWIRRLGPAAAENLMYLLGGFLVVAGAIYFASTAWTTMSGPARLLLLDGGLIGLGAMLAGLGRLLTRRFADDPAGRRIRAITAHLAAGLTPIAAIVAGRLMLTAPLMGAGGLAVVLAAGAFAHRLAAPIDPRALTATLAVTLGAAVIPLLPGTLAVALAAGALIGAAAAALPRDTAAPRVAQLGGATAALVVHAGLATGSVAAGAIALPALALALTRVARTRVAALGVLALALLAIAPAFAEPRLVALACLLATVTAATVTLRLDAPALWPLPLGLSLVAYVTARAPFAGLAAALRDLFAESLGYAGAPLPLAWYGLTLLPYLAGLGWVVARLDRAARPRMATVTVGWLMALTIALCGLAIASPDLRAPVAVLAAEGLTLVALGIALRRRGPLALGAPMVTGAALAGARWLEFDLAAALLAAELALTLLWWPVARRLPAAERRTYAWTAALPLVALTVTLSAGAPSLLAVVAPLPLAALCALRGRATGQPLYASVGAWLVMVAALAAARLLAVPGALLPAIAVAVALAGAIAHRALRPSRRVGRPGRRPLIPIGLTGAVVLALAPITLPAPPSLGWALAALLAAATYAVVATRLHVAAAAAPAVLALVAAPAIGLAALGFDPTAVSIGAAATALAVVCALRLGARSVRLRRVTPPAALAAGVAALVAVGYGLIGLPASLDPRALAPLVIAFAALAFAPAGRHRSLLQHAALALPAVVGLTAAAMVFSPREMLVALALTPMLYGALTALSHARPVLGAADRALPTATLLSAGLLLVGVVGVSLATPLAAVLALALYAAVALCARVAAARQPAAADALELAAVAAALTGPIALDLVGLPWPWLPTFALAGVAVAPFSGRRRVSGLVAALAPAGFALALHVGALQQPPSWSALWVPLGLAVAVLLRTRRQTTPGQVTLVGLLAMIAALGGARVLEGWVMWSGPVGLMVALLTALVADAFGRADRWLPLRLTAAALVAAACATSPLAPLAFAHVSPAALIGALALAALWTHAALRLDTPAAGAPAALGLIAAAPLVARLAGLDADATLLAPLVVALPLLVLLRGRAGDHLRAPAAIRAAALAPLLPVAHALDLFTEPSLTARGVALLGALAALALTAPRYRGLHRVTLLVLAPLSVVAALALDAAHAPVSAMWGLLLAPALCLALDAFGDRLRLLPGAVRPAAGAALLYVIGLGALFTVSPFAHPSRLPMLAALGVMAHLPRHRHPRLSTVARLAVALAAVWITVPVGPWLPVVALAVLVAAALLARAPRAGLHRPTAARIAVVAAALPAAALAAWTAAHLLGLPPGAFIDALPAAPTLALALTLGALAVDLAPAHHRARALLVAAVPLVALHPLATALFHAPAAPALELAALALLAARFDRRLTVPLAALALLATGGLYRDPATPLTLTLLAAAPLLALPRPRAYEATVYALTAAAVGWLVCLVPSHGNSPLEILPPIAAVITAVLLAARLVPPLAPRRPRIDLHLGALAVAALLANFIARADVVAPTPVTACALAAGAALTALALRRALTRTDPAALDLALALAALTHLWLAIRAPLAALDGRHLLIWAALAPMLRALGALGDLTVRLRRRALLMPLPALVVYLPDHTLHAIACLLAAAAYGLALPDRRRLSTWATLALLLVAAARLCLAHDVIDPAVYGLPAGLALLLGAHLDRDALGPRATSALQLTGLSIAWITTAAQIIRLDSPTHAVLLFALGLATVAVGWIRHRSDLLIAGAVAIIGDVTLHLLETGFARGFLGAGGLVVAGAVILAIAARHSHRRARPGA